MSRTKKALFGIASGYVNYFILTIIQLYLSPLVLAKYGKEALGVYASMMQLVGYLTILETAVGFTFNYYFAQAFGQLHKNDALRKTLGMAKQVNFLILGFSALLIFLLSFFIGYIFDIDESLRSDVFVSLLILAGSSLIKAPIVTYNTFLNAAQQMTFVNLTGTLTGVLRGASIILLLYLDMGIAGIVVGSVFADIVNYLVCYLRFRRQFPALQKNTMPLDKGYFKEVLLFSRSSLVIQITNRVRFQTDTLLVGIFLSVSSASIFYTSTMPPYICFVLANLVMANTLPGLYEIIGSKDIVKIRSVYTRLLRYVVALAFIALLGITFLNEWVVTFWVGKDQYVGWEVNTLIAVQTFFLIVSSFNGNFLVGMNKIKNMAKVSTILTFLGIVFSLTLVKLVGMAGLLIGSIIVMIPGTIYSFLLVKDVFAKWQFVERPSLSPS